MKKGIHPDYHTITVKMTNGETFETRSTYGEKGETLQLDVDPHTHPAWTGGGAFINKNAGKVADFNKRFGSIGLSTKKSDNKDASKRKEKQEEAPEQAEAKPEEVTDKTVPAGESGAEKPEETEEPSSEKDQPEA